MLAASEAIMNTIAVFSQSPMVTLRLDSLEQYCDALHQTVNTSIDDKARCNTRPLPFADVAADSGSCQKSITAMAGRWYSDRLRCFALVQRLLCSTYAVVVDVRRFS